MANNRMYLVCRYCGAYCVLGKYYPVEWYVNDPKPKGEELDSFLREHSICDYTLYDQNFNFDEEGFTLVYESSPNVLMISGDRIVLDEMPFESLKSDEQEFLKSRGRLPSGERYEAPVSKGFLIDVIGRSDSFDYLKAVAKTSQAIQFKDDKRDTYALQFIPSEDGKEGV